MSNFPNPIVKAADLTYKVNYKIIFEQINFEIAKGETFVITGSSGSGKTTLARIVGGLLKPTAGRISFAEGISSKMVSQQDGFLAATGLRVSYYSQRYENPNQDNVPTVLEYLAKKVSEVSLGRLHDALSELEIEYLTERKILSLSNGERKRVQLAEALLQKPDLLVLDQPFVGLDVHSREVLFRILEKQKKNGKTLVLVSEYSLIPPFANQVFDLGKPNESKPDSVNNSELSHIEIIDSHNEKEQQFDTIVRMRDVSVSFGGEAVLSGINWQVNPGEKWLLSGHNGAGKTTLLSLISADNPQGYSNDLVLFDRKRGSGESIWDIKKKIGFVSPELHLYFLRHRGLYNAATSTQTSYNSLSCVDVVLSGLKDEVGFTTSGSHFEMKTAREWLHLLGMEHLSSAPFLHSSLGEQRIILLARALVKSPDLLILDEPCQGLDPSQTKRFTSVLDEICLHRQTTLIYVTHRQEEVPSCISHFLALEKGKVKDSGRVS